MDLLATFKCKSSAIIEAHTDGVKADYAVMPIMLSESFLEVVHGPIALFEIRARRCSCEFGQISPSSFGSFSFV
jgi:hypothetical protein